MPYNPAEGFPRIMPSLRHVDVGLAMGFLKEAYGLQEHLRWVDEKFSQHVRDVSPAEWGAQLAE